MRYAVLATLLYLAPPAARAGTLHDADWPAYGMNLPGIMLGVMLLACAVVTGAHASHRRTVRAVLS